MEKRNRILIVDDTEMNRSLLADILSAEYDILEARDGIEAIALLGKYHTNISLVLLDIVMPRMDGFEVLTIMNKSGWIHSIPVITISAETSSSYITMPTTWAQPITSTVLLTKRRFSEGSATPSCCTPNRKTWRAW